MYGCNDPIEMLVKKKKTKKKNKQKQNKKKKRTYTKNHDLSFCKRGRHSSGFKPMLYLETNSECLQ